MGWMVCIRFYVIWFCLNATRFGADINCYLITSCSKTKIDKLSKVTKIPTTAVESILDV